MNMDKHSKIISLRTPESIDQEAADWLVKLDGGRLSKADRLALKQWLRQSPENTAALKEMAAIWGDMDSMLNQLQSEDLPKMNPIRMLFGQWAVPGARIAFTSILVAILAWAGLNNWSVEPETAIYVTDIGNRSVANFDDGSVAHLNTQSMVETEFSDSARIVRLLRGEALFDVAHEKDRPFIVYVGNHRVQALGTKFAVRLTADNIFVTVTDGQVEMSTRAQEAVYKANDQVNLSSAIARQDKVLINKGEAVRVEDQISVPVPERIEMTEIDRRLSWTEGKLIFEDERLEHVIVEISRYVPERIVITDQELGDVKVTGRFQLGDTEALLEAIEVSLNIQAHHMGGEVIHLAR